MVVLCGTWTVQQIPYLTQQQPSASNTLPLSATCMLQHAGTASLAIWTSCRFGMFMRTVRIHATMSAFNLVKQQSKPDSFPLNLSIAQTYTVPPSMWHVHIHSLWAIACFWHPMYSGHNMPQFWAHDVGTGALELHSQHVLPIKYSVRMQQHVCNCYN